MKTIILTMLLFSTQLKAENWLNHSKIKSGSIEAHSLKSECERISGEKCFDMGNMPSSVFSEVDIQVDDHAKPIYSKTEIQTCTSIANCDLIHSSKTCLDILESPIKNLILLQAYCSKWVGYEKKLQKSIAQDSTKLSAFQAQEAIKTTARQKESGIQGALKRIECGKRVIGLMILRNSAKVLTSANITQINSTYAHIKGLIETGSLATAKEAMLAVTTDILLVTQGDKDDLVAEITKCL